MVNDVTRSTSVRVKRTSGSTDKPETETTKSRKVTGQNGTVRDKDSVITVWGSYTRDEDKPEASVHVEEADHVMQSVSLRLPCFEEVTFVVSPILLHR